VILAPTGDIGASPRVASAGQRFVGALCRKAFFVILLEVKRAEAEAAAQARLSAAYEGFLSERDSAKKNEAGKELIKAIFGSDAVAEDPIR
jgi:hypothetical protein